MSTHRRRRPLQECLALHICTECEKQDARTLSGKSWCQSCRDKNSAIVQRQRQRRREAKQCIYCGVDDDQTLDGDRMCKVCRRKMKKFFQYRRFNHLCLTCGKELPVDYWESAYCIDCRKKRKKYGNHTKDTLEGPSGKLARRIPYPAPRSARVED